MALSEVSAGFEFTSSGVNIVAIDRKGFGRVRLHAWGTIELTPKGRFYEETETEIAEKIGRFLSANSLRPSDAAIALPRSNVIVQSIEIPQIGEEDVRHLMTYELEKHIPISADQVYFDSVQQMDVGSQMRRILVACPRAQMDRFLAVFRVLGIPVSRVDIDAFALLSSHLFGAPVAGEHPVGCLCDIDASNLDLTVFWGSRILFSRSAQLPQEITEPQAGLTEDQMAWRLVEYLDEQIRIISASLRLGSSVPALSSVVLSVEGARDPSLAAMLGRLTGIDTNFHAPGTNLTPPVQAPLHQAYHMGKALGMALRTYEPRIDIINLMPPEQRFVRKESGLWLSGALTGMLAAMLIVFVVISFWRQGLALGAVEARIRQITPQVTALLNAEADYKTLQAQLDSLQKMDQGLPSKLEILRELTRILPDGAEEEQALVWLTTLHIEKGELQIRGQSESPEGIIEIMENSPYFQDVRFDSAISKDNFSIKAKISKLSEIPREEQETDMADGELPAEGDQSAVATDGEGTAAGLDAAVKEPSKPPTPPASNAPAERERRPAYQAEPEDQHGFAPGEGSAPGMGMQPGDVPPMPPGFPGDRSEGTEDAPLDMEEIERAKLELLDFLNKQREMGVDPATLPGIDPGLIADMQRGGALPGGEEPPPEFQQQEPPPPPEHEEYPPGISIDEGQNIPPPGESFIPPEEP